MKGLFLKVNLYSPPQEGQQDSKGLYFTSRWLVTWGGLRRTSCGFIIVAFYPAGNKKEKAMELNPLVSKSLLRRAVEIEI